jgi:Ca2+/H+ antiporter, TMEM165/GDT1 family
MEAFLISIGTVFLAEMGDRTQLLSLVLAARYRRPWPILAGILVATLANHAAAAWIGLEVGQFLTPAVLDGAVGLSMVAMALWTLHPDSLKEEKATSKRGAFVATVVCFFIAEIGDKTEIATIALAAGYASLVAVVAGSTGGMLGANLPVVFLGHGFATRLPMKSIHYGAAALFLGIGALFIARAVVP